MASSQPWSCQVSHAEGPGFNRRGTAPSPESPARGAPRLHAPGLGALHTADPRAAGLTSRAGQVSAGCMATDRAGHTQATDRLCHPPPFSACVQASLGRLSTQPRPSWATSRRATTRWSTPGPCWSPRWVCAPVQRTVHTKAARCPALQLPEQPGSRLSLPGSSSTVRPCQAHAGRL